MAPLAESFASLIAPVTPEDFLARYWERGYLHLERNRPGLYDDLFGLGDVDRWILATRTGDPDGILVVPPTGSEVSLQRYRTGELAADQAYEAVAEGHSLILNQLEKTWPPLGPLLSMLGEVFCARIGVNAYLTPVGSKAFPVHIDNHDAFILQVFGEKVWQLHEFEHLPVSSHSLEYKQDLDIPPLWDSPGEAPRLVELRLRSGDLLYIPRGMPHCAVARDAPSLHLTVSINALYWLDFLKAAVEQACFSVPALRRSLPPRFVSDPLIQERMRIEFGAVLEGFLEQASFDATLAAAMRRRVRLQGYPQDGHISQLLHLDEVVEDSLLERRPGLLCMVDCAPGQGTCKLRFGGGCLKGPARLRSAMEFVRDHPRFRAAELPGLDASGQVVLARRLVRMGLLRLSAGQGSGVSRQEALSAG